MWVSEYWELARVFQAQAGDMQKRAITRGDYKDWIEREFAPYNTSDAHLLEFNRVVDYCMILSCIFEQD